MENEEIIRRWQKEVADEVFDKHDCLRDRENGCKVCEKRLNGNYV